MLRSWIDRLDLFVAPWGIVGQRLGPTGRVIAHWGKTAEQANRDTLLRLLAEQLAGERQPRRWQVTLASPACRYQFVPWNPLLAKPREGRALAHARLRQVHGELVGAWPLALLRQGWGQPALAAAIDPAWIEALDQLADKHKARIERLDSDLARLGLPSDGRPCLIAQPGLCLLLTGSAGAYREIRLQPTHNTGQASQQLLQEAAVRAGVERLPDLTAIWLGEKPAAGNIAWQQPEWAGRITHALV